MLKNLKFLLKISPPNSSSESLLTLASSWNFQEEGPASSLLSGIPILALNISRSD